MVRGVQAIDSGYSLVRLAYLVVSFLPHDSAYGMEKK